MEECKGVYSLCLGTFSLKSSCLVSNLNFIQIKIDINVFWYDIFLISHSDHLINQKLLIDKTIFLDYLFVMKKFMEFIGGQIALAYLIIFIMLVIALFFI